MDTKSCNRSPAVRRGDFYRKLRPGALAAAVASALALATVAAPRAALAQEGSDQSAVEEGLYSCGKARGPVSVSFKPDVELKDLITWAMGFTCKNFVYGSGIGGRSAKVTIIAPKKMTPQQAWRVFLVGLETMNLTIVPKGNVLSIIEAGQAKSAPLPIYRRGGPAATAQLVRMIMRPEHVPVDELSTAINAIKSKDGTVTAMPKVGILVVTDYGDVISKMRALVAEIDQPIMGERLYMIKVRNADATEIVTKLQEILGSKEPSAPTPSRSSRSARSRNPRARSGRTPQIENVTSEAEVETAIPSKMIADERTNSVIVLASEAAYLRVRALIRRMDIALDIDGAGRIHVHTLENADSEELAQTLTAVIQGVTQPSTGRPTTRGRNRRAPTPPGGGDGGSPAFEGQVRVTHDKPTNSLVVVASVKDYLSLREVIRKLDVPRRQVFIEAVILEVKADNSRDLGFSYHGGKDLDSGSLVVGGLQHSNLASLNVATLASSTGLLGGIIGPLLPGAEDLLGVSIPSFGVLFQALATSNNVNVLSSPHILTTDNEEAEISVGENIPYQASFSNVGLGAGGAGGGFGFPIQSVQRQDVALTLKITPQVNASDMVTLEIDQEISDIASPNFEGLGPSWAKRTIKTTVVVRDQQSIVIGGLMSDRVTYSESKIPLLGDIPLFGHLFKYTQKSKAKTNLLVLLTPYIINDQIDIEQIVQRKVRERAEFLRSFSTFHTMEFRSDIDYRRKRGLIEEINRTVRAVEQEAELRRELDRQRVEFPDGPVHYDDADAPVQEGPVPTTDASEPGADKADGAGKASAAPDAKPDAAGAGKPAPATQPSGAD